MIETVLFWAPSSCAWCSSLWLGLLQDDAVEVFLLYLYDIVNGCVVLPFFHSFEHVWISTKIEKFSSLLAELWVFRSFVNHGVVGRILGHLREWVLEVAKVSLICEPGPFLRAEVLGVKLGQLWSLLADLSGCLGSTTFSWIFWRRCRSSKYAS